MRGRWGPGPESAGATGDARQARAEHRSRRGGGPDRVWCASVVRKSEVPAGAGPVSARALPPGSTGPVIFPLF